MVKFQQESQREMQIKLYFSLKHKKSDETLMNFWGRRGAKECKSDRSRQELSNQYFVAKFDFDTAENEPSEVCQKGVR